MCDDMEHTICAGGLRIFSRWKYIEWVHLKTGNTRLNGNNIWRISGAAANVNFWDK